MRKKPMVAGNWKMHGSRASACALAEAIKQGANGLTAVDVVIFPPFVHLLSIEQVLQQSAIAWGAQNLYLGSTGAFTGEISGPMLKEYGCQYVLIGHSERRTLFHEDLSLVAAKFKAAVQCGLKPVLCVGETLAERERAETEQVIRRQLESVFEVASMDDFAEAVIAYEPVWAIGTGLTASPKDAQAVHAFIRAQIHQHHADLAAKMRILYGGSVKADNAKALFAMPDIDGGLVGGASLDAEGFLEICRAAE